MNQEYLNNINQLIDKMVGELKKELISGSQYKPRYTPGSFWDRIKRFWSNAIIGPNDTTNNKYAYQNKFGSLGETEPEEKPKKENRLSLHQYKFLSEQYDILEKKIVYLNENVENDNIKNIKLFRIIDSWAVKFKDEIKKLLMTTSSSIIEPEENQENPSSNLRPMSDPRKADPPPPPPPPGARQENQDEWILSYLDGGSFGKRKTWDSESGFNFTEKQLKVLYNDFDNDYVNEIMTELHQKLLKISDELKIKIQTLKFDAWKEIINDLVVKKINDTEIGILSNLAD